MGLKYNIYKIEKIDVQTPTTSYDADPCDCNIDTINTLIEYGSYDTMEEALSDLELTFEKGEYVILPVYTKI